MDGVDFSNFVWVMIINHRTSTVAYKKLNPRKMFLFEILKSIYDSAYQLMLLCHFLTSDIFYVKHLN